MKNLLIAFLLLSTPALAWDDDDSGDQFGNPVFQQQQQRGTFQQYNYQQPLNGRQCVQWNCVQMGPTQNCSCGYYQ